jgi:diadenosine tetraphosphate (Ap4A) HIT family hydrolase
MYRLHPQLEQDTLRVGDYVLCEVRLMNDARYPWLILVPKRAQIQEIYELTMEEQQQLVLESSFTARQMMQLFSAQKMNVAALGNQVAQLHIHHVARFSTDAAWPQPIWGAGQSQPYSEVAVKAMLSQVRNALDKWLI